MNFDPTLVSTQHCYQLITDSIVPRPIAWISSLSKAGILNLAPYSFFTVASANPPILLVSEVKPRNREHKDTLTNLHQTKQCVVNIVSATLVAQMNASCADYPPNVSEFEALNIKTAPSQKIRVDGVAAALVRFECELNQIIEVSKEPSGGSLMLLNVVNIFVNDSILKNERIAVDLLHPVGKLGGENYANIESLFQLARPVL